MKKIASITVVLGTALLLTVIGSALTSTGMSQEPQYNEYYECTNVVSSNFNGTPIPGDSVVWFNSVFKVSGLPTDSPVTVYVTHATVSFTSNSKTYSLAVPSSEVGFSPSVTLATTDYEALLPPLKGQGWYTQLQSSGLAGNDFSQGLTLRVPKTGFPGGIMPVTWQAEFSSYTPGLSVNWQWGAAVYSQFSGYESLGVKPVDDNNASQYKNSDHAGTPENFKSFVIGGATGGGGSNFTGSYSGTGSCQLTPQW